VVEIKMEHKKNTFEQWKKVMFDPISFYAKLDSKGQYKEACKYFLKVQGVIIALIMLLFVWVMVLSGTGNSLGTLNVSQTVQVLIFIGGAIIIFPILLLFAWGMLWLNAGIMHLFVLLFGGKKAYSETFKVYAYSISPNVFSAIPFVNWFSGIYMIILQIVGIKIRHKLSWAKSMAIVIVPLVIIISIVFMLYLKYMLPLMLASGVL
jgi:hypothetical protein